MDDIKKGIIIHINETTTVLIHFRPRVALVAVTFVSKAAPKILNKANIKMDQRHKTASIRESVKGSSKSGTASAVQSADKFLGLSMSQKLKHHKKLKWINLIIGFSRHAPGFCSQIKSDE